MPVNDVLPSLPGSSAIPFFHIILFNFIVHMTPLNLNGIGSCRYIPVILLKFFYEKQLFRLFLKDVKRSEEHTSELQSRGHLVCRLLLEKKKKKQYNTY